MTKHVDLRMIERPVEAALTAIEASLDKAASSLDQADLVPASAKERLQAAVATGKAGLKGICKLKHEALDYAETSLSAHMAASQAVAQATSLTEVLAVLQDYLQTAYHDALAQGSKLTAIALTATGDVAQPATPANECSRQQLAVEHRLAAHHRQAGSPRFRLRPPSPR